jgi:hypothetical protein
LPRRSAQRLKYENAYRPCDWVRLGFGYIFNKPVPIAVGIIIGVGVGIGIGIEGQKMGFGHEKLDVYRTSIEYVGWVYRFCA